MIVRFYGVLRTLAGLTLLELDLEAPTTIRSVLELVRSKIARKDFDEALFDPLTNDPRPNAVLLVSGREIGTMSGMNSPVTNSDEVTVLPIVHGGQPRSRCEDSV